MEVFFGKTIMARCNNCKFEVPFVSTQIRQVVIYGQPIDVFLCKPCLALSEHIFQNRFAWELLTEMLILDMQADEYWEDYRGEAA